MQIARFILIVVVSGFVSYMFYLWAAGRANQQPSIEQQRATIKEWQAREKAKQEKAREQNTRANQQAPVGQPAPATR